MTHSTHEAPILAFETSPFPNHTTAQLYEAVARNSMELREHCRMVAEIVRREKIDRAIAASAPSPETRESAA